MYTKKFLKNSDILFSKKSLVQSDNSGGSGTSSQSVATTPTAFVVGICLASAFALFALIATTFYYYRKRTQLINPKHKVLLIKKDIPLEKSFVIRKTPAVRSPSSGQVNPLTKKSPSPTSVIQPSFSPTEENGLVGEQAVVKTNNVVTRSSPTKKVLGSVENLHKAELGAKDAKEGALGQLHFKLKYSYEKRALCLVILRCTDLPSRDSSNGSIDPFVKMQLLPDKQHKAKTRVLRKTQNPIYNEEFTFYSITPSALENLAVHFVVLNFDRFSRDEILGEVVCKLNQFEFDSLEKQITLARDIAPRGHKQKVQELGELLVSLCYQPIANRLTVVILKARNLPKMDLTGLCDPYVKIYVFHNNQRISKKRTHVKKRTLSPVFNESFVFDIPAEEGLDNLQLQFLVYDHDRVTRNELIGKVDIGTKTGISSTEKHWHDIIKSPRRQIAEWHKLKE